MEFTVDTAILKEAVIRSNRATPARTAIESMKGLLLELDNYQLSVTGGDLTLSITTHIPVTAVSGVNERALIDAKLLTGIATKLPEDMVSFKTEENIAHITCGKSVYDIQCMNPADYPDMEGVRGDIRTAVINQNTLSRLIATTGYAASDKDTRPVYTGVKLDFKELTVTAVAVDGFRLAVAKGTLAEPVEAFSVIIPAAVMTEVSSICALNPEATVTITAGSTYAAFEANGYKIVSRVLEGTFLDYESILKSEGKAYEIKADDLAASVARVAVVVPDVTKTPARLTFKQDTVDLAAVSATGTASDSCPVYGTGTSEMAGFNIKYLSDVLKCCKGQKVKFIIDTPTTPAFIIPENADSPVCGDNGWTHMILPVRLKA